MISPVTNKVPYASSIITSFKEQKDEKGNLVWDYGNLIYNYNFVLILNEFVYSVKSISGIDRDYLVNQDPEGGNEWPIFTKNYINSSFIKIGLQRAMPIRQSQISSSIIRAGLAAAAKMCGGIAQNIARRAALLAAAALDPIATLENGPAIGIIQVFNKTFTKDVANFKFFSYGAERWSADGLDASSGEIVIESIDLICSDLTRMTSDWSKGPSGIWNKNSDGSMYDEDEIEKLEKFRKAVAEKQKTIKELYKEEDSFTDKQIKDLEKQYDELIGKIGNRDKKLSEQKKKIEEKKAEREEKSREYAEELEKSKEKIAEYNAEVEKKRQETKRKKEKYEEMKSDLLNEEKEKNKDEIYDDAKSEEIAKEKEEQEKQEKEKEEEQEMKKKAAEEVKKEIDRLKRLKEWKDSQKT